MPGQSSGMFGWIRKEVSVLDSQLFEPAMILSCDIAL